MRSPAFRLTASARARVFAVCFGFSLCATAAPNSTIVGRVVDRSSGAVISCTVTIRPKGGSVLTENPGFSGGFRSSGVFEKTVPPGEVTITVRRGFDYGALSRRLDLKPGERAELKLELRRRTPLHGFGWYCSDNHVHMIHGQAVITPDFNTVALAARAEGLDLMSIAQRWAVDEEDPARITAVLNRTGL